MLRFRQTAQRRWRSASGASWCTAAISRSSISRSGSRPGPSNSGGNFCGRPDGLCLALEKRDGAGAGYARADRCGVDDPRFGLCLDVGHANTRVSETPPLDWIAPMAPWLRHVHLHNNDGDWDLHDALGRA